MCLTPLASKSSAPTAFLRITGRRAGEMGCTWADKIIISIPFSPGHGLNRFSLHRWLKDTIYEQHDADGLYNPVTKELINLNDIKGHEFSSMEDAAVIWILVYERMRGFDFDFIRMMMRLKGRAFPGDPAEDVITTVVYTVAFKSRESGASRERYRFNGPILQAALETGLRYGYVDIRRYG
ncbi:hypothetical protein Dda_3017 [Drechslerella dactyloides]|uniref:Uncharacterized protein n=1 Tax=Drechslerella dactyloides TaxID=74499 RepID=A0AAD6J511_DREDA|nr:hypothetical protein Dda_3017 [Drechslerella dactyloides]